MLLGAVGYKWYKGGKKQLEPSVMLMVALIVGAAYWGILAQWGDVLH